MSTPDLPAGSRTTSAEADIAPSLGAQAIWLLGAKTIGFAMTMALPLVLVRGLSQEEFGLYKQIFFIVGTAVGILPLGFGMSAFYFLPREPARRGAIVVNILGFHVVMGVVVAALMFARPDALAWLFNNPELALHARSTAVVVLLWTAASFLEVIPIAMQDVRASTIFIVMSQFSKTLLLLLAALTVGTVDAIVTAAIVQGAVQITVLLWYLHARFPGFWKAFDRGLLQAQASYALPLGASGLLLRLQQDLHHGFVSNAFGPAAYAIYAVGVLKVPLIAILRESVGSVVLPRINELENRNDFRRILELVAVAARRLALVYFPAYALLMVTGRDLIGLLFTEAYAESWPIFAIALTTVPLGVIILDPVTRAHNQRYFFLRMRVAIFTAMVVVLWLFTPSLGLQGVIAAVVVATMVGWSISVVRMARMLEVRRRDLRMFAGLLRIAVASGLAAAAALWVQGQVAGFPVWVGLLVSAVVFSALYLLVTLQMGELQPDQISSLVHEVKRAVQRSGAPLAGARPRQSSPQPSATSARSG